MVYQQLTWHRSWVAENSGPNSCKSSNLSRHLPVKVWPDQSFEEEEAGAMARVELWLNKELLQAADLAELDIFWLARKAFVYVWLALARV